MDDVKFPNFSQSALIFPIPWAPAPFPKRGVRALVILIWDLHVGLHVRSKDPDETSHIEELHVYIWTQLIVSTVNVLKVRTLKNNYFSRCS